MINLFHINEHNINTGKYSNLLHDKIVTEFEDVIADYVGAKYAVTFNSATSAIFLALKLRAKEVFGVPSMIPPVVLNAIRTSGSNYIFNDNTDWVGDSYVLAEYPSYKIIDSAQKLEKNQFKIECNDEDLMVFSHYPTKPVGGCDGGMIVSNDKAKIDKLREMALNGMTYSHNNWERKQNSFGYKMYMNSIQAEIALENFKLYENKLLTLNGVRKTYNTELGLNNTSNHLYRIEVNNRDEFITYMKNNGVDTGIHYNAAHLHPVLGIKNANCPISEVVSKKTLSIPFHERLTFSDVKHIIGLIKNYNDK